MIKTKDLLIEIREQQLEMLPHEEEFVYLIQRNNVQNNKRRIGDVLDSTKVRSKK